MRTTSSKLLGLIETLLDADTSKFKRLADSLDESHRRNDKLFSDLRALMNENAALQVENGGLRGALDELQRQLRER